MDMLKQASLTLRFVKFQRFLGSLFFSYQRDWAERQFKRSENLKVFEQSGNFQKAEPTTRGGHFYLKVNCLANNSSNSPTNRFAVKQPFERVWFQKNFQSTHNQQSRRLHDEQKT